MTITRRTFSGGVGRSPADTGRRPRAGTPAGRTRRRWTRRAWRPDAGGAADLGAPARRSGRARSRAGAVGQPLHRLPRLAGARLRDRSEYHPDENRQLRSHVVHARQRARAVPQGGASDAERQAERELYRRGDRRPRALPAPARQRHDARRRRCSRSATSWSATRRRAKRISTAPVAAPRVTTPPPAASPAFARASRSTVDLQQRMLFPVRWRAWPGRARRPHPIPNAVTVTVTPASGPAMSGVLVERSDFYVTFAAGGRHHPRRPHDRRQGGHDQSASGAHRSARPHHRQADS